MSAVKKPSAICLSNQTQELYDLFVTLWSQETSYLPSEWSAACPARGQCVPTALIIHDYFQGEIKAGRVLLVDGKHESHYWNQIGDIELDLTLLQYSDRAIAIDEKPIPVGFLSMRDCLLSNEDTKRRYKFLKSRIDSFIHEKLLVLTAPSVEGATCHAG